MVDDLERGRASYRRHEWADAFAALSRAEEAAPLAPADLELRAWSAALSGHDDVFLPVFERLYHRYSELDDHQRAARVGFWLGMRLMTLGEMGRATGWLSRAQRSVERVGSDCVERGYLMLPTAARHLAASDFAAARDVGAEAGAIGERFGDADLVSLARQFEGRARMRSGDNERGIALLDEAMLAVVAGELSPLVTGLIYCSAISTCQQSYALGRAREWTSALASWCEGEPQMAQFTGSCMVHRSEILQLGGAWSEAFEEAKRACELMSAETDPQALADACYQRAELHRLRGELTLAEEAYRHASQLGREPHPGLALLRLAQGRKDDAVSAIRRVLATTTSTWRRPQFLPACIEILLAAGELEEAEAAARELEAIAAELGTEILDTMAVHARGAVQLAQGDAAAAMQPLRRAFQRWQAIGAPYIAARIRVLLGRACQALGDHDGAELELAAARQTFEELGAAPDLDALPTGKRAPARPRGLSPRELEVLRLVAKGKTNKEIAGQLCVSERTVDRHVSNIFGKLDVSTRAAATAFAYEHALV